VAAGDFGFTPSLLLTIDVFSSLIISDRWTTISKKSAKQAWKKDAKKCRKTRKKGAKKRRED
jgi:hypothetical protein